ncbi:neurogenic differentiation factor 2-like [Anabrus simplex]|uniref:neurogenic differentiation factor 2-like n=1 Tax=Anabrus simplex TaxID=316456 RepID=UPI0035A2E7B7
MNSCMQRIVSDTMGMNQRLSLIDEVLMDDPIFHLDSSLEHTDSNNNSSGNSSGGAEEEQMRLDSGDKVVEVSGQTQRKSEKYSLRPRSIQKRLETEQRGKQEAESKSTRRGGGKKSSNGARPKQKPPPLSKYRRKTANARERDRMREINAAFESLRRAVPHLSDACNGNEKLTKITTLRLAMKYIAALSQALKTPEPELGSLSDLDCLFLGSDTDSLALNSDLSDQCLTPHSLQDLDDTDLCHPYLADSDFSEHCLTP